MLQVADYPDHFCDCPKCVDMCERVPCRPLPSEIAGMPDDVQKRLRTTYLEVGVHGLQAGTVDGTDTFGRCTFLTDDGKCELHGTCKPFEGRKATCGDYPKGNDEPHRDSMEFHTRLSQIIYEEWATDEGQQILKDWQIKYDSFSVS